MSDLVGNPEDRFSQNEAQILCFAKGSNFKVFFLLVKCNFLLLALELLKNYHVRLFISSESNDLSYSIPKGGDLITLKKIVHQSYLSRFQAR